MHSEKASRIFNKISELGVDFISSSFGEVGSKLVYMFNNFGNHPETDSFFFEDRDISLCGLMDLAQYAKRSGIDFMVDHFPYLADRQCSDTFKKSIMPGDNARRARFLRKPIRCKARSSRRTQQVCSSNFLRSTTIIWESIPSDFSIFIKGVPSRKSHEDFGVVSSEFEEMGCRNLAIAAKDLDSRFNNPACVFGYKKLCVMDACRILAKSVGRAAIEDSHYKPLIIPFHLVKDIPQHVRKAVDDADHCDSLFFDSAFDNYSIITPFQDDISGVEATEVNYNSVLKSTRGCVLGERDGESYFVCEWFWGD